jgi:hypothetical protein
VRSEIVISDQTSEAGLLELIGAVDNHVSCSSPRFNYSSVFALFLYTLQIFHGSLSHGGLEAIRECHSGESFG